MAIFVLYLRWLMRVSLRRGVLCKLEMNGESAQIIGGYLGKCLFDEQASCFDACKSTLVVGKLAVSNGLVHNDR